MKKPCVSITVFLLSVLAVTGCNTPVPVTAEPTTETSTPTAVPTETLTPTATPTPLPTPTETVSDLEIIEWAEYPYANLADPNNTNTHVEILVYNPNEFPVRVDTNGVELRLLNTTGEIVYTNPNPVLYIWEGSWILGGETVTISACVCFETDDVERQAWESLELVAPLESATDIIYTHDVDVNIGEFFSLSEAHLGGDQLGGRDHNGKYERTGTKELRRARDRAGCKW